MTVQHLLDQARASLAADILESRSFTTVVTSRLAVAGGGPGHDRARLRRFLTNLD